MKRIYLDNNATTCIAPEVYEAYIQALQRYGNPSSIHSFGRDARALIDGARDTIAQYLLVQPQEIVFTSSGTESVNTLLRGALGANPRGHVITSLCEHAAVYETLRALEDTGTRVTYLSPGPYGACTPDQVQEAITTDTRLIALMAVNNETGVKTDVEAIAAIAESHQIPCIVDAVQLLGKDLFTIPRGVSAMAFSGHKIHAPKGVGFIVCRKHLRLTPLITGGNQELGHRAGTENAPAIAALGIAVGMLDALLPHALTTQERLRDMFESELADIAEVNGTGPRVANTSNLYFPNTDAEGLLQALDLQGIAASHGSACATGALEPSRVLTTMYSRDRARSSLRFSLSRYTTEPEIIQAVKIIHQLMCGR